MLSILVPEIGITPPTTHALRTSCSRKATDVATTGSVPFGVPMRLVQPAGLCNIWTRSYHPQPSRGRIMEFPFKRRNNADAQTGKKPGRFGARARLHGDEPELRSPTGQAGDDLAHPHGC